MLVEETVVLRDDAQSFERPGPRRVDHLKPLHAAVLGQAIPDGAEVPQTESGEVRRVLGTNVHPVKMALAGIDGAPLPVGNDGACGPVERAGREPSMCQVLAGMRAGC